MDKWSLEHNIKKCLIEKYFKIQDYFSFLRKMVYIFKCEFLIHPKINEKEVATENKLTPVTTNPAKIYFSTKCASAVQN